MNSWPDNANLDKARRLLWPIKQKYGKQISWADLMILAGNVAIESMGLPTFGFGGGREDVWEPEEDLYWGSETTWLGDERYSGDRQLDDPLGAVQMGLIYVNPEGPNGNPDPAAAARDIRETFARMAMNDEETVALIAGGHTFGKAHGAADPGGNVGREPEAADIESQGLGWINQHGSGSGVDSITSGLEGAWTDEPTTWDNGFFHNLFGYEWELTKSPAGAHQWTPVDEGGRGSVPDAHDPQRTHAPMMLTTDLALRVDPAYEQISRRFYANPSEFADTFARAWFKLTHRDMGPVQRYRGPEVPSEQLLWQDPLPAATYGLVDDARIEELRRSIAAAGISTAELVSTAWASASTFRASDKRGGANGARVRLSPQIDWDVNRPEAIAAVLDQLESVRDEFNQGQTDGVQVSMADLIVLAGGVGIELAAKAAGVSVQVPFSPGRVDALLEETDIESIEALKPARDGFRNFDGGAGRFSSTEALLDRAALLDLNAVEMTLLVGGLRVLQAGLPEHGVLTATPGRLTNDFFVNLLDMTTTWGPAGQPGVFSGRSRSDGTLRWTATEVDLVFGSNSQLRAVAEVYASSDAASKFVDDFVAVWVKVMNADRFDLR